MKNIILFTALLGIISNLHGQEKKFQTKILGIGDSVPDISFDYALNYGKHSMKLSDFKGKMVILDFWATWCTPCISAFPKMHALQEKYKDKIQVIAVSIDNLPCAADFFKNNHMDKELPLLPIAGGGVSLKKYFDYRTIPHEVWIGIDGRIKAITDAEYVTDKNIMEIINSTPINWPVKDKNNKFDPNEMIFGVSNSFSGKDKYHSGFSSYIEGAPQQYNFAYDSLKQVIKYNLYNFSIPQLYAYGYDNFIELKTFKRWIIDSSDYNRFFYYSELGYRNVWDRINRYCYELVAPNGFSKKYTQEKLIKDLDFFFKLKSSVVKKKVNCLILKIRDSVLASENRNFKEIEKSGLILGSPGDYKYIQMGREISYLLQILNEDSLTTNMPFVIADKSVYALGKINLELNIGKDLNYIPAWRAELYRYGLDLISEDRELEMLVLSQNK